MGVPLNNRNYRILVQGYAMFIFLPQSKTNVSLFESVAYLVSTNVWNFLEDGMLYDNCIEN